MYKIFQVLIDWALERSIYSMLKGAGLGLASSAITLTIVNHYLDILKNKMNVVSSDLLSLFALGGFDYALSMIIGAIIYKVSVSKSLRLVER